MIPSAAQIQEWSEDTRDGFVRMPLSAWQSTMDFLYHLEALEDWLEETPEPFTKPLPSFRGRR